MSDKWGEVSELTFLIVSSKKVRKLAKNVSSQWSEIVNAKNNLFFFVFLLQVVRPWGCQNRLSLQGCLRLVPAMEPSMLIPERTPSSTLLNDLNQTLRLWLIILPRLIRPLPMVYQTLSNLKWLPKLRLFLLFQLYRRHREEMSIITSVTETEMEQQQQQTSKLLFRQEYYYFLLWMK